MATGRYNIVTLFGPLVERDNSSSKLMKLLSISYKLLTQDVLMLILIILILVPVGILNNKLKSINRIRRSNGDAHGTLYKHSVEWNLIRMFASSNKTFYRFAVANLRTIFFILVIGLILGLLKLYLFFKKKIWSYFMNVTVGISLLMTLAFIASVVLIDVTIHKFNGLAHRAITGLNTHYQTHSDIARLIQNNIAEMDAWGVPLNDFTNFGRILLNILNTEGKFSLDLNDINVYLAKAWVAFIVEMYEKTEGFTFDKQIQRGGILIDLRNSHRQKVVESWITCLFLYNITAMSLGRTISFERIDNILSIGKLKLENRIIPRRFNAHNILSEIPYGPQLQNIANQNFDEHPSDALSKGASAYSLNLPSKVRNALIDPTGGLFRDVNMLDSLAGQIVQDIKSSAGKLAILTLSDNLTSFKSIKTHLIYGPILLFAICVFIFLTINKWFVGKYFESDKYEQMVKSVIGF